MNFAPILPEIILGLGAIALMMVAAFVRRSSTITHVAAIALLVAACFALIGAAQEAGRVFDGMWAADGFAAFGKVIIYLAAAVAIVMAHGWFDQNHEHGAEYAVLILLSALGASVMVSASDLMMLYVGLELQSLSAYVLASYRRHDERSAEAGLKYFVLGGLASGILLYGISLLYGFAGTTGFEGIAAAFAGPNGASLGLLFGLVFTLAGIAFKIAAVPFHMWTPDVYEGAPTPVTAFFAAGQKAAAILLATRVCLEALGPVTDQWRQIVIFAALASIVLGAVAAYGQTNVKRLLAYSSINNVGFALVGLAAGGREGATAVLVYSAVYVVMTLGAFLCIMRMRDADGRPLEKLSDLSGLSQTRPLLALAIAMFMLSLAGIPPLFGFWPKLMVFFAAVNAGFVWLAVAAAVLTVIGAFYYLKVVKVMYFDTPAEPFAPARGKTETALIAACAIAISPLGYLLISPLTTAAADAASVF
ncbi:NADH-quinone oxidoreductase subunit NuoN [Sphingomonas glaciei]|uniref:NADH-quinone oxidoreductase subunit N n=1 Tax=Sphingomonas glaciei TaxID=2938948 RepID=A0ABY5MX74_9SPHN|nr:NADH-quinone oxidoreductase subunit NuoN [Sphingomonas glaciei]UUR09058.1 NADH-quinone oxidoreductase subunit NuoN [Sphingomonas glaciei]